MHYNVVRQREVIEDDSHELVLFYFMVHLKIKVMKLSKAASLMIVNEMRLMGGVS